MKLAIVFLVFLAYVCGKLQILIHTLLDFKNRTSGKDVLSLDFGEYKTGKIAVRLEICHPSYIEPCSRKSNLTSCILSNIETIRPYLDDGIPDLSLPPFAPYFNPKIAVSKDGYTLEVVNVTYRSFEKFQVRQLDLNLDAPSLDVEIWFPDLMCWGIYTLLGNMAGQTFNSSGIFFAKAGTFVVREKMQGTYHEVKGKRYLQLKGKSFEYEIRNGFGYIENVYPGEPMKSLLFNVELNDHFVEFFKNADPFMQNGYEQEIVRAFSGVFGRYPIEELFP